LASPAVERAAINALDSPLVDKVWDRLLKSDEAQKLVERVAEAPEVRAAIASQGVGLLEDIGRQIRRIAHRLDGAAENLARRITFQSARAKPSDSDNAGLVTRAIALGADGVLVTAMFFAGTAAVNFTISALTDFDPSHTLTLVIGGLALIWLSGSYLFFFWTLAGQTPGMRFVGISLDDYDGTPRISPRAAWRRLFGLVLAAIPFGAGFWMILFSDRRRALQDRMAHTEVILVDRRGDPESAELRAEAHLEEKARRERV
jgi:uncharacterized RDD family membrane protein YckC